MALSETDQACARLETELDSRALSGRTRTPTMTESAIVGWFGLRAGFKGRLEAGKQGRAGQGRAEQVGLGEVREDDGVDDGAQREAG